ncbi:hypothetical protein L211DRAFT_139120 [Terfezia boudieri ATCC MYA-4762]|uniref:Uncharacterized protein n=1 Tax=Terfezia boudieri ATCC MYA-4762 TaxID=1051890 RepID=A0A3N4LU85_9PEZI|nr:hypothetical protein L211DRAFT_139120 [Terfezia boudieri ATCC MYA-4762]
MKMNHGISTKLAVTTATLCSLFNVVSAGTIAFIGPSAGVDHGSITARRPTNHPSGPELELSTPSEGATTVEIAVITNPKEKWAQFDRPEVWEKFTVPVGEFVVFSKTPTLARLASQPILTAAIPGGVTCATFTSPKCDNKRSSGKDDFHCAFNLQGAGNIIRWGIPTKPQCMLCLKTDDATIKAMKRGRYDRFGVELCEPHEDIVKERKGGVKERGDSTKG